MRLIPAASTPPVRAWSSAVSSSTPCLPYPPLSAATSACASAESHLAPALDSRDFAAVLVDDQGHRQAERLAVLMQGLKGVAALSTNRAGAFTMTVGKRETGLSWATSYAPQVAGYGDMGFPMLQILVAGVFGGSAGTVTTLWVRSWWAVGGTSGVE
jgi:hypothetical protein